MENNVLQSYKWLFEADAKISERKPKKKTVKEGESFKVRFQLTYWIERAYN